MDLKDKKVLIVGTGISGIAGARLCYAHKAQVILYDGNKALDKEKIKESLEEAKDIQILLGGLDEDITKNIDLLVLSPGVPTDLPFINKIRNSGILVWGEVELAYNYSKGKIAAITGTNGKTTTTALTSEIMKTYYESVFVVGNIGIPYTQMVCQMKGTSVTVAEISSFQLETVHNFRADVSAILNISPDHLNRHHTMECYIEAKKNITKNQKKEDTCVLNYEDDILRQFGKELKSKVIYFSSKRKMEEGIYLQGDEIILNQDKEDIVVCNLHELKLLGIHNYENIMAAIAIAMSLHVPVELIKKAITAFKAVEHRIEFVAEKSGVKYYNDSKGTNPDAAIKAVEAMVTPTLLIGGGYDKDSEYGQWIRSFGGKVKLLVLIGQTRDKIADSARSLGFHSIVLADTLEEAVQICVQEAVAGDSVLLSPACASWGMFADYEERGRIFKELVRKQL